VTLLMFCAIPVAPTIPVHSPNFLLLNLKTLVGCSWVGTIDLWTNTSGAGTQLLLMQVVGYMLSFAICSIGMSLSMNSTALCLVLSSVNRLSLSTGELSIMYYLLILSRSGYLPSFFPSEASSLKHSPPPDLYNYYKAT
jgi:hypothetical protein